MNPNDLIYYKQSGGGIQSLGYNFKNILLQKGLPVSYSGDNNAALNFFKNAYVSGKFSQLVPSRS